VILDGDEVVVRSSTREVGNSLSFLVLDLLSWIQILNGDDILQEFLGAKVIGLCEFLSLRLIDSDVEALPDYG
jgi:hypothetical protein